MIVVVMVAKVPRKFSTNGNWGISQRHKQILSVAVLHLVQNVLHTVAMA